MYNAHIDHEFCFAEKSNVVAKDAVSRWTGESVFFLYSCTCKSGIKLQHLVDYSVCWCIDKESATI